MRDSRSVLIAAGVTALIGCLTIFALAYISAPKMGDAYQAARRGECVLVLKQIYAKLIKYIDIHKSLPKNSKGQFEIERLLESSVQSMDLRCPGRKFHKGHEFTNDFIANPSLSIDDLQGIATNMHGKVILCDNLGNHPRDGGRSMVANLLHADGAVVTIRCSTKEYQQWIQSFKHGEEDAAMSPPNSEYDKQ